MEIKITANTVNELGAKLNELAKLFNVDFSQMALPIAANYAEVEAKAVAVEVVKEEKKEKKPKKVAKFEEMTGEVAVIEAPAVEKVFTKQDVADACQKLSQAKNIEAARNVLSQFKNAAGEACRRISDVQEADYGMFVKACDEASLT
jgi:hypothetical protein